MKDNVAAIDQFGEERFVVDRVDEVLEPGSPFQVRDVVERTGGQVVEHQDFVSLGEQSFGQMGADEAGSASNQRAHSDCPFMPHTASAMSSIAAVVNVG